MVLLAGIAQLVEHYSDTIGVQGSNPCICTLGGEAQVDVQQLCKLKVEGSKPFISTKNKFGYSIFSSYICLNETTHIILFQFITLEYCSGWKNYVKISSYLHTLQQQCWRVFYCQYGGTVDTRDLKSLAARRRGSSPLEVTKLVD